MQRSVQEGMPQGVKLGELTVLRRLIEKRVGSIPDWVEERLRQLSVPELEELSVHLLEVKTIAELLG